MRIALISNTFFPHVGGSEYVVHNLAASWQRQGHKVCVFNAVSENSAPAGAGYEVKRFRIPPSYFKLAPHRFPFGQYCAHNIKRKLDEFEPEFISAHMGYPLGAWMSKISPLPRFLMTCHGRELTKFPWGVRQVYGIDQVLRHALNDSAGVVAISSHARNLMLELGVKPEKIVQIPNGVDVERFHGTVNFDLRKRLNLPPSATVVLSVGREHPQKAYDSGIRAFARIAAGKPDAHYVLLGRETGKWSPLVRDLNLQNRVVLCDGLHGDELVGAYQQADIFFSPSIWELMPLVVLEAMAAGLPLIVTNVSGSQDLVQQGRNGFIVEPGEEEKMADNLDRLLGDPDLRRSLGELNAEMSEGFSWDRISRRYLEAGGFHT